MLINSDELKTLLGVKQHFNNGDLIMSFINELSEKRANLVKQAQNVLDNAQKENRSVNAEEQANFDKIMVEVDSIKKDIDNRSKIAGLENKSVILPKAEDKEEVKHFSQKASYRKAFDSYCRHGRSGMNSQELRDLEVGTSTEGGNITAQEYEKALLQGMDEFNFMRKICTVITTASDRNIPVETSISTATWVDEEGVVTKTSDPVFGKVTLSAYALKHIVKYSMELAQDSVFDLAGYLGTQLGRAFGIAEETAFVYGTNSGQPNGALYVAAQGVKTASASAITGDELLDFHYSLAKPYRDGAVYVFNDATVATLRKLKDGNGQYIWTPGFAAEPDTILGKPVYTSSACPTIAGDAKVGLFFNPKYYVIADRANSIYKMLDQLYAENGQYGIFAMKRTDGDLTLAAAAKALVMQ